MEPSPQEIEQAKKQLDSMRYKDGKLTVSWEKYNQIYYIATGIKEEKSPKEPEISNRSFFHLKSFPCEITIRNEHYKGIFNHEDHKLYYSFTENDKEPIYFSGGSEFNGTIMYRNYKPVLLTLIAKYPSTEQTIIARASLTSSQL